MNLSKSKHVLFAHDGPLFKDDQGEFYGLQYNNKLVERYSILGEKVSFIIRFADMPEASGRYSVIDNPAFNAIRFPNLKSLKSRIFEKHNAEKIMKDAVLGHDIIIARLPSSAGSMAVKYALKFKKPLMVEFVACGWDAYWNYSWKGRLVAPYFFVKQRLRMQKVPYVIYVTNNFLQGRYPTKGKHLGISDVELPMQDATILEQRIKKIKSRNPASPLIIGTLAAIDVPYKGQADVIRAISELKKRGIEVHYHLVGQGDPSSLQSLITKLGLSEQVFIKGSLTHDKVFAFLDQMDVYIQPSKVEGLPRSVIEAMSRGCTVLGSNVGGIPELIQPQLAFKVGNIKDIAHKIEGLTEQILLDGAGFSIKGASAYSKETLEIKRKKFYEEFLRENNLC